MTWSERGGLLFCILCSILIAFLILKYALIVFLPFLLAWGLALLTAPISKRISKQLKISKKLCSTILTLIFIGGIIAIVIFAINRLIFESERLIFKLSESSGQLSESIAAFFEKISALGDGRLPIFDNLMKIEAFREFWENIDTVISNLITDMISSVTRSIPSALLTILKSTPAIFIFILITVVSCFYFAADIDRINRFAASLLPKKIRKHLPELKQKFSQKVSLYIRAYLLLLFLTFGELFVGFSILGVSYPFLLAVIISLLDILPILGVGTVLIPWALIEILFLKDLYTGIGLFIIYVIVTVVRQITEPKIVAGSLGLHPLTTLISMYAGLKLFGFIGMLIGPILILVIRSAYNFFKSDEAVDSKIQM